MKKIFLLDDDLPTLRLFEANLLRQRYEVVTWQDGATALEQIRAAQPDLLILEPRLSNFDGYTLIRDMRDDEDLKGVPFFLVSNWTSDHEVFKGWREGCTCYLTKPCNPMELVTYVKRHFANSGL